MTTQPLNPVRKDVFILLESLDVLSDQIQNEIDVLRGELYLLKDPSLEAEQDLSNLIVRLEDVALARGRLQPNLEDLYDEGIAVSISGDAEAEGLSGKFNDDDTVFMSMFENVTWEQFVKSGH